MAAAVVVFLQRNERVTYLNLSHNDFAQEGAIALGRAIGKYNVLDFLYNLYIFYHIFIVYFLS